MFDHPKFGLIPCVSTISDIQEGEEITVGYGYELEHAPDWYRLAWENSELIENIWTFSSKNISGLFGQEGVDYKDWLDCTVKFPIALNK